MKRKIAKILNKIKPYFNFFGYVVIVIIMISTFVFWKSDNEEVWTIFGYIMVVGLFGLIPLYVIKDLLNLVKEVE